MRARQQPEEIAHILDPCYHISPASPRPSILSVRSTTTWRDDTGKHDPDFRPFPASRSPSSASSSGFYAHSHSPRASFDYPVVSSSPPPSKAERRAARRDLDPVLREALRAHEREVARENRRSWLRRKPQLRDDADMDGVPVFEYEDEDAPVATPTRVPCKDRIRLQLAGLSLRVDLAVFRAKKRLRARLGLS